MFFRYILCILIVAVISAFSNYHHNNKTTQDNQLSRLKLSDGDVILRESRGLLATLFRNMSKQDKHYSHAGFIVLKDGKQLVAHYINANSTDGFVMEPVESFVDVDKCRSFAIFRFHINDLKRKKIKRLIDNEKFLHHAFDDNFDLNTDNKMYCTEWIYKTLKSEGNPQQ